MSAAQTVFYTGSYAPADGKGIARVRLDMRSKSFHLECAFGGVENPSFVLAHPGGCVLYAVEEVPDGSVAAFWLDGGAAKLVCKLPSGGADPCHLSLDEENRFLFAANYTGGSLAVFELDAQGIPLQRTDLKQHTMSQPRKGQYAWRQDGAHVHFSACRGDLVYVCDLGLDTVFCYRLDRTRGTLEDTGRHIRLPAGAGPRHLCFHPTRPELLYVCAELTGQLFAYRQTNERWELLQTLPLLPQGAEDPSGHNGFGAAIRCAADGLLYASLRVLNRVAACRVEDDGRLHLLGVCGCGAGPRDFAPAGDCLILTAQDGGCVQLMHGGGSGGLTLLAQRLELACPTCIAIAPG